MGADSAGPAWIPQALTEQIRAVTVEGFRVEDFRFDRDLRLGRQLLFLLSNTEWTRRTTELVEISRARAVDTEVVVDVDLSYAVHSGLHPDGDRIWLPLFTVPITEAASMSAVRQGGWRRNGVRHGGGNGDGPATDSDPLTSLEVSDAAGARIPKAPQNEVQHWIAAALADLLVKRLPRDPADTAVSTGRDELLLLAASIRLLLLSRGPFDGDPEDVRPSGNGMPGTAGPSFTGSPPTGPPFTGTVPAGPPDPVGDLPGIGMPGGPGAEPMSPTSPLDRVRARTWERVGAARSALLEAVREDLERARPALSSRLGDMIAAMYGTTFVMIEMDRWAGPTSFTVRMPARRLRRSRSIGWWQTPRARLRIDLLTASANTDRLIRLTLPEGVTYLPRAEPRRRSAPARIEVQEPRPFGELRALVAEVLAAPGEVVDRPRQRLARMGAEQVDACLPVLGQYRVPASGRPAGPGQDGDRAPELVRRLTLLQTCFRQVVEAAGGGADDPAGVEALRLLREIWQDGAWLPRTLERRVLVNTDTPGVVHLRTTAAEGSAMRASPTTAMLDIDVAVTESTVLDTARDTSLITMGLLAVVTVLTLVNRGGLDNLDAQTLSTVLVLFPAIQAGRIERPDRGSLRGLLAQSTYLFSLATVFPPVVLAAALALREGGPDPRILALSALAAQGLLHLVLRRRPTSQLPATATPAALLLETEQAPDLARLDRIRGRSCRSLIAEGLLLGREAHAYAARDPARPGALEHLLQNLDGEHGAGAARRGDGGGLLGLMRSEVGGEALTFVVHGQPVRRPGAGGGHGPSGAWSPEPGMQVLPVPFTSVRPAPVESPAWSVEVLVGLPRGQIRRLPLSVHPVSLLARVCRDSGFPILLVQHPALPPAGDAAGLEWLRLRVSVPFVPGENLSGLHRFFAVVDGLREAGPGRSACAVHVYVTPELASYEAPETAADEAARRGGIRAGDAQAGTRLTEQADVIDEQPVPVLPLALCAGARVGLIADLLDVVATRRPRVRLAGVTISLLHGLTVTFLYCTDAGPDPVADDPVPPVPGAGPDGTGTDRGVAPAGRQITAREPGHPAFGLGALIRSELEGSDEVHVAVEAMASETGVCEAGAPGGTGAGLGGGAGAGLGGGAGLGVGAGGGGRDGDEGGPRRSPGRAGPLVRLQLRTPDRVGVVPSILERASSVVRGVVDGPGPGLDVWFALLRVVDGRTLQGRMGIWLPGGDWRDVDWSAVTEEGQRFPPLGREGGSSLVEDDPVLAVNLARVSDRIHVVPGEQPSPDWAPPTTGQTGSPRLQPGHGRTRPLEGAGGDPGDRDVEVASESPTLEPDS